MEPKVEIDKTELVADGFTSNGVSRYIMTVRDYAKTLHKSALALGNASKGKGLSREVSQEHVRAAAALISGRGVRPGAGQVVAQILEYVATATAGVSSNHLSHSAGLVTFVVSIAIGVILVAYRLNTRG